MSRNKGPFHIGNNPVVFGIVSPGGVIRALTWSEAQSWDQFFSYPLPARHTLPFDEAIKAYQSIGYSCRRFALAALPDEPPEEEAPS